MRGFRRTIARLGFLLLLLPAAATGRAETPEHVVRQLGSDRFQDRYDAERRILENPESLYPALQMGVRSADPELQARASRLLKVVQRKVLERQFEKFRKTGDRQFAPAGWDAFSDIVGDSEESVELYLSMFLAHPEPMAQVAASEGETDLQAAMLTLFADLGPWQQDSRHFEVSTFATILYLAATPRCRIDRATHQQISNILALSSALSSVQHGDHHEQLRRLVGRWVQRSDAGPAESRFHLADRFDLDEILSPALELLTAATEGRVDKNATIAQAILCVAKRGTVEHLEHLEPLWEDDTRFHERSHTQNGVKVQVTSEIRDVALLAAVHLTSQAPSDFGFKVTPSHKFLYMPETAGFRSEDDREEAFKKWATWRRLHWQGINMAPVQAIEGVTL